MKYLNMNQIKYVQDLVIENFKTLLSKIKEDLNRCRDILCSWIERLHSYDVHSPQIDL